MILNNSLNKLSSITSEYAQTTQHTNEQLTQYASINFTNSYKQPPILIAAYSDHPWLQENDSITVTNITKNSASITIDLRNQTIANNIGYYNVIVVVLGVI